MATVGTLNIDFATNVAVLMSDMRKAAKAVDTSSNQMTRSLATAANGVKAFVGAWATIATAKQIASLAGSSVAMADSIGEAADRLGIATDAYQTYSVAAAAAGFSQEEFNGTLDTFNKNIGLAINGQGKAKDALEAMGIDLEAVKKGQIDAGDVLMTVAGRLEDFGSKAEQAAVLVKLFGAEAGPKMAAMLAQGREGLDNMAKVTKGLGLAIDNDLIRKAMQAGDSTDLLSKTIKTNFKAGMLGAFIDEYNEATHLMTSPATAQNARATGEVLGGLVRNFLHVSGTAVLAAQGVMSFGETSGAVEGISFAFGRTVSAIWHSIAAVVFTAGAGVAKVVEEMNDAAESAIAIANKLPGVNISTSGAEVNERKARYAKENMKLKAHEAAVEADNARDFSYVNENLRKQNDEVSKAISNALGLAGATKGAAGATLEFGNTAKSASESFEDFNFTLLTTKKKTDDFYNNLIDRSIDAGLSMEDWRDTAVGALKDFAKELLHVGAAQSGGGSIGGFLAQQVMGFFGGGLYSTSDSGIPIPGHKPTIPTRDVGGDVTGGQPYKVGVPEIFIPRASGKAVPLENLGGDTYYIDARGADAAGLARLESMIRELNGSIEPRALSAVQDMHKRSGSYLR